MLFAEALEGQHRPPVRVLDDHTAAAVGDQPAEQLGHHRPGIARIGRGSNHDHRVFASRASRVRRFACPAHLLGLFVADSDQDLLHRIVAIMNLDRNESAIRLDREFLARFELC